MPLESANNIFLSELTSYFRVTIRNIFLNCNQFAGRKRKWMDFNLDQLIAAGVLTALIPILANLIGKVYQWFSPIERALRSINLLNQAKEQNLKPEVIEHLKEKIEKDIEQHSAFHNRKTIYFLTILFAFAGFMSIVAGGMIIAQLHSLWIAWILALIYVILGGWSLVMAHQVNSSITKN